MASPTSGLRVYCCGAAKSVIRVHIYVFLLPADSWVGVQKTPERRGTLSGECSPNNHTATASTGSCTAWQGIDYILLLSEYALAV